MVRPLKVAIAYSTILGTSRCRREGASTPSERWIYSAVLCFRLDLADQERTGFRYHYSVFQAEYSRNLLFTSGQKMDRVFSALIDRVRGPLDLRTVKTLFGRRQRPRRHKGQPRAPVVEVSLETPEYDLTILRIRFRRLVLKIYTKGERVLRIEAMAHNARDLGCRLGASHFPEAVEALRQMVDRFIEVLDCLDATFIDAGLLDRLPRRATSAPSASVASTSTVLAPAP